MKQEHRSEKYYPMLDALRGFASFSVVLYHLSHWLNAPWLATNSNLAVDMFYCLSGFVLASAYSERKDMSFAQFAVRRFIRLTPLVFLATIISAAYILLRYYISDPRSHVFQEDMGYETIGIAMILGTINVPYFYAPHVIGGPELFPLNGPQYTLFFEVFVNLLWWYARHLPQVKASLFAIVLCAPLSLALGFGGANAENFISGFPRVIMCFGLGVLVFHSRTLVLRQASLLFVLYSSLIVMLCMFYAPIKIYQILHLCYILFVIPAVVLSGSRINLPTAGRKLALMLGALSYPVYVLHYPIFMWINGAYRKHYGDQNVVIEGSILIVALFASFVVLKIYDQPVRSWLSSLVRSGMFVRTKG